MEKLETAEEQVRTFTTHEWEAAHPFILQTRHKLKVDLLDPRWRMSTLFVQLMIECAEQLFPVRHLLFLHLSSKLRFAE